MIILAVDDEPGALQLLCHNLAIAAPEAEIVSFGSALQALDWFLSHDCDIAFLDIELGAMNGIELGKKMKAKNPRVNLIFVTAYLSYAASAHTLHASGYLSKPCSPDSIRLELENLRYPMPRPETRNRLRFQCFGSFEAYCSNVPLHFKRSKTKELLALLVDRQGSRMTSGELCARLWEEDGSEAHRKDYLNHLLTDLSQTLNEVGEGSILLRSRGGCAIAADRVDCDYYDYIRGIPYAVRAWQGEYMNQYSWAEERVGTFTNWNDL